MSRQPAPLRRQQNERLPCSHRGCFSNRVHLSRFCRAHDFGQRKHGHPDARSISRAELAPWRELFAQVLSDHESHPAVAAAVRWMEQLLDRGRTDGTASPIHAELRRLADSGLQGREALCAAGAVWVFAERYPHRLPSDERLTFQISRQLLLCGPAEKRFSGLAANGKAKHTYKQPSTHTLRTLGQLIRETLGGFFAQVVELLEKRDAERLALADALRTPLTNETQEHDGRNYPDHRG